MRLLANGLQLLCQEALAVVGAQHDGYHAIALASVIFGAVVTGHLGGIVAHGTYAAKRRRGATQNHSVITVTRRRKCAETCCIHCWLDVLLIARTLCRMLVQRQKNPVTQLPGLYRPSPGPSRFARLSVLPASSAWPIYLPLFSSR